MTATAPPMVSPETAAPRSTTGLPTYFGQKPALDGIRAIAVGSAIAYHFGSQEMSGGFLGVDMFFVLSGYIITSLLIVEWGRTSKIDLGAFWARRARRLLPALFLMLLAVTGWSYFYANPIRLNGARLVLLSVPPRAAASQIRSRDPVDEKKTQHLNHLFHVFARRHPQNVSVVELAHVVCPSGPPCPAKVGGVVLRARDGGHFDGAGPSWVAPRLLHAVLAALPTTPAASAPPTTGAP